MSANQDYEELMRAQGEGHLVPTAPTSAAAAPATPAPRKMGIVQKVLGLMLLTVVVVAPTAAFYSYFSGIPLHLLASTKEKEDEEAAAASRRSRISLVQGMAHTVEVPDDVVASSGMRKGDRDAIVVAQRPKTTAPLVLPGSTMLDPARLARIRARFAPARVVKLGEVWGFSPTNGHTEFRELRQGDPVSKGDLLGVFYSVDVGSKKNDLLQALVQFELDQKILDRVEANRYAVTEVFRLTEVRQVQGDRAEIHRALNNLKLWDIPQEEIDALRDEAKKLAADKDAWLKTPEGRWVMKAEHAMEHKDANGGKEPGGAKRDAGKEEENPWGRVTLRAPFDGIIVERNVHVDEMVVDNTVNLFQIADTSRLKVVANCPEDQLPILESLGRGDRRWTVTTAGFETTRGLSGTIDELGQIIDPNQHTAAVIGYVENPEKRIRAGQYVSATVNIPPPDDVVEIPVNALVEDGLQSIVFVQPDPDKHQFTMRRVQVTHRFAGTVFVRRTPIPKEEQLTAQEAEEGLLPKTPLRPGELVLTAGSLELKRDVLDLESRSKVDEKPADLVAKAKARPASELDSQRPPKPKARRG
jgi:cobalt-zinc-cadmium efflux system membrane fusion protein